jgi:hypothetical protein
MDAYQPGPDETGQVPDRSQRAGKKLERSATRRARDGRAKKVILIGSVASFLGFFGLSIAGGQFTGTQATDTQATAIETPAVISSDHHHDDDEQHHGTTIVNGQQQIRTRTS